MSDLIYGILGVIIGSILTAVFSTKNFKEMVNFKIGKIRCWQNNQRHFYKYYCEMFSPEAGKLSIYRCEVCGDLTTGKKNVIYDKRNDKIVKIE